LSIKNYNLICNYLSRIYNLIIGEKSDEWAVLSTLTIRSIVAGVISVAVIQALLALIGFVLMGVPFAVLLEIGIMFLTTIQVPAFLNYRPYYCLCFFSGISSIRDHLYYLYAHNRG